MKGADGGARDLLDASIMRLSERGMSPRTIAETVGVPRSYALSVVEPVKWNAWRLYRRALWHGDIERPDECEDCGANESIQGHHPDYTKPLDVEWLCIDCHASRHTGPKRAFGAPRQEESRAVWAVAQAMQIDRAELFASMTMREIVNRYRFYLGRDPLPEDVDLPAAFDDVA